MSHMNSCVINNNILVRLLVNVLIKLSERGDLVCLMYNEFIGHLLASFLLNTKLSNSHSLLT